MRELWRRFLEWYYEPSGFRRLRRRAERLHELELSLRHRERQLNARHRYVAELETALSRIPEKMEKVCTAINNMERRLDTVDGGYGALLGVNHTDFGD